MSQQMGRRAFLRTLGYGAGAAVAFGVASQSGRAHAERRRGQEAKRKAGGTTPKPAPVTDEATARFLGPTIRAGAMIEDWKVIATQGVSMGAISVVMATPSGQRFQVDVLRRDADAPGVAETKKLALYVSNSGDGKRATVEEQGLGARALAEELARREADTPAPALLTLRERAAKYPNGVYAVAL